ncbi:OB-fold domain-containing protein [Paracandidimonas lactea]|uniref:OB-fold domain-containing protein n=1 Tax=Paracandidimonas lactea TaxID=2895524 RepID=UPI001F1AE782
MYSLTQVASRDGDGPVVLLVDLDEGVRVMGGACVDDMAHIRIGSRVTGGLAAGDEQGYIMFEPEHPAHDI